MKYKLAQFLLILFVCGNNMKLNSQINKKPEEVFIDSLLILQLIYIDTSSIDPLTTYFTAISKSDVNYKQFKNRFDSLLSVGYEVGYHRRAYTAVNIFDSICDRSKVRRSNIILYSNANLITDLYRKPNHPCFVDSAVENNLNLYQFLPLNKSFTMDSAMTLSQKYVIIGWHMVSLGYTIKHLKKHEIIRYNSSDHSGTNSNTLTFDIKHGERMLHTYIKVIIPPFLFDNKYVMVPIRVYEN